MSIHIVLLTEPNDDVAARIKEKYPDCHQVTDAGFLVQTREITQDVAVNAGIKGDDRVEEATGVVFKLNGAYSGYAPRALWEWLGQAEEAERRRFSCDWRV